MNIKRLSNENVSTVPRNYYITEIEIRFTKVSDFWVTHHFNGKRREQLASKSNRSWTPEYEKTEIQPISAQRDRFVTNSCMTLGLIVTKGCLLVTFQTEYSK
jgi:hypothetical protein